MIKEPKKISLTHQLYKMKVGEKLELPLKDVFSVRSMCSQYSMKWGRKYTTKMDRKAKRVYVTRVKATKNDRDED